MEEDDIRHTESICSNWAFALNSVTLFWMQECHKGTESHPLRQGISGNPSPKKPRSSTGERTGSKTAPLISSHTSLDITGHLMAYLDGMERHALINDYRNDPIGYDCSLHGAAQRRTRLARIHTTRTTMKLPMTPMASISIFWMQQGIVPTENRPDEKAGQDDGTAALKPICAVEFYPVLQGGVLNCAILEYLSFRERWAMNFIKPVSGKPWKAYWSNQSISMEVSILPWWTEKLEWFRSWRWSIITFEFGHQNAEDGNVQMLVELMETIEAIYEKLL